MAKSKPYQFIVDLPEGYDPDIRQAIASEIISFVRQRTLKGEDFEHGKFPKYSKAYQNSLDFKATGKSNKVNLMLSGDMLANIDLVKDKEDQLVIGYSDDNENALKAEGNQIGSYGREANSKKARKFLGITSEDLNVILRKYPMDSAKADARADAVNEAQEEIDEFVEKVKEEKEVDPSELVKKFRIVVGK